MTTIAALQRALRDVEGAMPPLAMALHAATPAQRAAFADHRRATAAWVRERPGPAAWQAVLDGVEPPEPPRSIWAIVPPAPVIAAGDDVASIWADALERMM